MNNQNIKKSENYINLPLNDGVTFEYKFDKAYTKFNKNIKNNNFNFYIISSGIKKICFSIFFFF